LEWAKGEIKQQSVTQHFSWAGFDIRQKLNQYLGLHLRYDRWIPDVTNQQSYSSRSDLGLILFGEQGVNQWLFLARESVSRLPNNLVISDPAHEFWLYLVVSSYE
jgi:hypothetical protein